MKQHRHTVKCQNTFVTPSKTDEADPQVQLQGNFSPVEESPVHHELEVVGNLPKSLQGVYLRNGANPQFEPEGGHHFFNGDGRGARGSPSVPQGYRGAAREWGMARLALYFARSLAGIVDPARGLGVANAGLIYHNGRLLAMSEDDQPYHVHITDDGDLETVQRLGPDGSKAPEVAISLPDATMMHDFAITRRFVVIPDQQVVFRMKEMLTGGSPGDEVFVLGSSMTPADAIFNGSDKPLRSLLSEICLNTKTGKSSRRVLANTNLDAGQLNRSYVGKKNRFLYMAIAEPWPKISGIAKVDLEAEGGATVVTKHCITKDAMELNRLSFHGHQTPRPPKTMATC
ncbi:hypothetical protein R1flu_010531 [Riccia fluitans]|uniref:Uncharacterized protein n=1 Tax=Riccia fluitans TaxID=41844 RepID=A0ABD1Z587_9MARC